MEEIEVEGEWWLPSHPDRKIGGRLISTASDGIELSLIGTLRDGTEEGREIAPGSFEISQDDIESSGDYGRIHGQVSTTAYTLDDCFQVRSNRNLLGGLPTETIRANQVFRGAWYDPDEEVSADRLQCRLLHLAYWMPTSGLRTTWMHPGADVDEVQASISVTRLASESVPMNGGLTATIAQSIGTSGDGVTRSSIDQDFVIDIVAPTRRSHLDLMASMQDVQDALSIGLNRTACIQSVSLFDPDLVRGTGEHTRSFPVDVLARWSDRDGWREPRILTEYDHFFSYADVGSSGGLTALLAVVARYRSEVRRVMATRNGRSMFPSDRLLNRAAALESFDKERTGTTSSRFRTRLRRCADLAGEEFRKLVGDVESWLDAFKRRRDLHAHHLERSPDDGGFFDVILADTAYILFALCLLREAHAPARVFETIPSNSEYLWLARQAAASIPQRS